MKPSFTSHVIFNSIYFPRSVRSSKKPDKVNPQLILSLRLLFLLASPLLPELRVWKSPSAPVSLSSSRLLLSHANAPSPSARPSTNHSCLTSSSYRHKASFDFASLHSNLLSLRITNNIPRILPSHHFLALKLAEPLNCPADQTQFLKCVKAVG